MRFNKPGMATLETSSPQRNKLTSEQAWKQSMASAFSKDTLSQHLSFIANQQGTQCDQVL